jgi:broad specificity phosphatase PhoE
MSSYFYFTRHGQTIWNVENKICGATDIALIIRTARRIIVLVTERVSAVAALSSAVAALSSATSLLSAALPFLLYYHL